MSMNLNKKIAERVKELRTKQGLTMEKLAYESDISKGGLSEIERGMKEPRISTLMKIAESLEIPLKDLFDF